MKNLFTFALPVLILVSCGQDRLGVDADDPLDSFTDKVDHEMIELGDKLDDPYSVDNVNSAIASLYPTKAGRSDVTATDLYVRFLPSDDEQLERLCNLGLELVDHPVDYQIVREGDYYHDPDIPEDEITWQYAVVDRNFVFPKDIRYEILDECYISENDPSIKSDGLDWEAIEREAYRLTGNSGMLDATTKGSKAAPAGRITIVDKDCNGGQPFGVAGVKVVCNSFVKIATTYTDRDGYYQMGKRYSSKVRYRLMFKNTKGFNIGFNLVLIPASISTLGKGSPEGKDVEVTEASDGALFRRCVVNNAAYDYITRCEAGDMDIKMPPKDLRIWIFKGLSSSSAVMLHQGAVIDNLKILASYLDIYRTLLKLFAPDITIGAKGKDYKALYDHVVHELAHASHFAQVGKNYWTRYVAYMGISFLTSGGTTYGTGLENNAGYAEVGEMWAYFMQSVMYQERYGGPIPSSGTSYWFYPQILRYMYERGMTRAEIFKALDENVNSRDALQNRLVELYPDRKSLIDNAFMRYER
ncbi:MAG: hypothetical protein IK143_03055 [Bacteroidales bacterium]|nr:hypothetical protein [Bacteroidales bacterium]